MLDFSFDLIHVSLNNYGILKILVHSQNAGSAQFLDNKNAFTITYYNM
jgi:hypothetical protein